MIRDSLCQRKSERVCSCSCELQVNRRACRSNGPVNLPTHLRWLHARVQAEFLHIGAVWRKVVLFLSSNEPK